MRTGWWVLGVVLLAAIVVVVWISATNGDETASVASPGGVATADGTNVLSIANDGTALQALAGTSVEGTLVRVQGFVPGGGFWVGTGDRQLFVADKYASLETGDLVDLTGVLRALPSDFRAAFGVEVPATARLLDRQGVYLDPETVQTAS